MLLRVLLFGAIVLAGQFSAVAANTALRPNIVYILCDDLGYGDVKCLNPEGKISTPNIDALARAGMVFTDAHSSSAVCTPTRYSILTGRYNWRSRLQNGVLGGMSPPLIEPGRLTVASLLQQRGYHTAGIGKWHLGWGWPLKSTEASFDDSIEKGADGWRVDFKRPVSSGPTTVGFDYYFGIAASLDMVPYTFIENDRVLTVPTTNMAFPMMLGRTNKWTRRGPGAENFTAEEVLPTLTRKAVQYISRAAASTNKAQPFFLYLPFNAPHTPIAPTEEWRGRSGLNPYADFVMETDWAVGQVLAALDTHRLASNTLVIFTSDNGCSPEADFKELAGHGHNPSYRFRGTKADIWDGGHHIPFIARWPGRVRARSSCDQIVCLSDLMATVAEIVSVKLPDNAAEDSVSFVPALFETATGPIREAVVHHSINGSFAIRQGNWKLELCSGSGGWSAPRPKTPAARKLPPLQLYDLSKDIGETNNVASAYPEVVQRMTKLLEKYVADGRSTPGKPQTNDVPIVLWKDKRD